MRSGLFIALSLTGCWTQDLVDDTFTPGEWAFLSTEFRLPTPVRCPDGFTPERCDAAAELGHALFFDQRLSGEIVIDDPAAPGRPGEVGRIACASCHDSRRGDEGRRRYFVDRRSEPNNVSSGSSYTRHNALSLVNLGYKDAVARDNCRGPDADPQRCGKVFSWTGIYDSPGAVLALANGKAAMNSSPALVAATICAEPRYAVLYQEVFDAVPDHAECPALAAARDPDDVVDENVKLALEAYVRRLESVDSPFDRYVAGDHAALSDAERRGLRVFIREGSCIECHRGPLLSDLRFHNTGVAQRGLHVPAVDDGLAIVTGDPDDTHAFLTPSLRNVAETGPYMHAGQLGSLREVIELYRRGGDEPGTFTGMIDPRLQPLEIDDEDAADLEAFLHALTGREPDAGLAEAP